MTLHRGKFFLAFFLFLARNGLEFLVSCKKSKSKKNGTHTLQSYSDASRICKENGGKMFEPKNELVYDNIVNISKEKSLGNIWLGLNDLSNEGNFVYNSDNSEVIWTYWSDSNPDDYKGKEDCVETEWKFGEGKWNDVNCNSLRAFVCEFDN